MIGDSEGPSTGDAREFIELDLRYETIRDLQTELAPKLSNDGLFLPSEEAVPPDTVVRFRVMLPGDFVLIEGTGVVVWTRAPGDEQGPPGLAIRYVTLPSESQETIDAIIDAHLASGGMLFNLEPEADAAESFPTDALDYRSLSEPGASRKGPFSAAQDALSELEEARVRIRDETRPAPAPPSPGEPGEAGSGGSLEDEYLASVERQVEQALAGVREPGPQVTEPVDPELIELTTDLAESAALPISLDIEADVSAAEGTGMEPDKPGEPESTAEPGHPPGGADTGIESVIPEFLDRWRHEVEVDAGEGARTERLEFEESVDEAVADAMPVRHEESGESDLPMVGGQASEAHGGRGRWWLAPLLVGIAGTGIAYVVWLWTLGDDAQESAAAVVEQVVEPRDDVVDVMNDQPEPEADAEHVAETEQLPPPIAQPSLEPATVVDSITWGSRPEGTEVVIRGNGTIAESSVETFALSEPPRILVRLREIQQEYSSYELPVGTAEVERIRIGYHPELTPPALYVVLDLTRGDVRVSDLAVVGDTARVTVR